MKAIGRGIKIECCYLLYDV